MVAVLFVAQSLDSLHGPAVRKQETAIGKRFLGNPRDLIVELIYPLQIRTGTRQEFTDMVSPFTSADTMHTPQPPSWHMAFVPRSFAWSRMKTFRDVQGAISSVTETNSATVDANSSVIDVNRRGPRTGRMGERDYWYNN